MDELGDPDVSPGRAQEEIRLLARAQTRFGRQMSAPLERLCCTWRPPLGGPREVRLKPDATYYVEPETALEAEAHAERRQQRQRPVSSGGDKRPVGRRIVDELRGQAAGVVAVEDVDHF